MSKQILFLLLLSAYLNAQTLDINSTGWKLLGALETLNIKNTFNNLCIQSVWGFKNGVWRAYSSNSKIATPMQNNSYFDANFTVSSGEGFWLYYDGTCQNTAAKPKFTQNTLKGKFYIVEVYSNDVSLDTLEILSSSTLNFTEYAGDNFSSYSHETDSNYSIEKGKLIFSGLIFELMAITTDYIEISCTSDSGMSCGNKMRLYKDEQKSIEYYNSMYKK